MRLRRLSSDRGATLVEHAVLIAVLVVPVVPALAFLEGGLGSSFESQAAAMSSDGPALAPTPEPDPDPDPDPEPVANVPPVAAFSVACEDLTCTFGDSSTDLDGEVAARTWDFGDTTTSTDRNPSRTYASAGTFTVTLTVVDERGASDVATGTAVARAPNEAPEANFEFSCERLACSFTDASLDDRGLLAWDWTFGGGATSAAPDPQHTFPASGRHEVQLTVTDTDRVADTVTRQVVIPEVAVVLRGSGERIGGGQSDNRSYTVSVTATGSDGRSVAGVRVAGSWSNSGGAASCATETNGTCTIRLDLKNVPRPGSRTFTVSSIDHWAWDHVVPAPLTIAEPG